MGHAALAIGPQGIVHGGAVAWGDRGLLIIGPSGSGKSALALMMMGLGAQLIADDQIVLTRQGDHVISRAPKPLHGMIEARGVGLLHAAAQAEGAITAVVDLARKEAERLPPMRHIDVLGSPLPLFYNVDAPHFPSALVQYLKVGRAA